MIASSAASPPAKRAGALGAPEDAERREHHADGELHRVLRHARQRRSHRKAGRHHDRHRRERGHRGEADPVLVGAEREHDEHDLEPVEQHALERDRERVAVMPARSAVRHGSSALGSPRKRGLVVQRLEPAARRIALRSHCRPNTSSSPPTTTRTSGSGARSAPAQPCDHDGEGDRRGGRLRTRWSARTAVVPIASTIVSASTASTAQARNTDTASPSSAPDMPSVWLRGRVDHHRGPEDQAVDAERRQVVVPEVAQQPVDGGDRRRAAQTAATTACPRIPDPSGPVRSGSLKIPAARMIGVASRNANRAASSLSSPRKQTRGHADSVAADPGDQGRRLREPERPPPCSSASSSRVPRPIRVSLGRPPPRSRRRRSRSAAIRITPLTIRKIAAAVGLASATRTGCSSSRPRIPVGMLAAMISHASFSVDSLDPALAQRSEERP